MREYTDEEAKKIMEYLSYFEILDEERGNYYMLHPNDYYAIFGKPEKTPAEKYEEMKAKYGPMKINRKKKNV